MKKVVVLVLCLFLIVPIASAFSFSEFFSNLFGSEDSVTGYAVGDRCRTDRDCGSGETCSRGSCAASVTCGDGKVASSEKCDDGNTNNKDGCSSSCTVESGYSCSGAPSRCSTTCGDGTKAGSEECDDGGSNTDTACSASYGSSCTYCTTSCSSVTVQGASCGDGTCDTGSETCSSCSQDCGSCNIQTEMPSISFSLTTPQIANVLTVSTLTVSNGNQCWISIDQTNVAEASTKRGRSTGRTTIFTNKPIDCDSAKSDLQSELQQLANGEYSIIVTAENNLGVESSAKSLKVTGAAVTISGLDSEITYTNLNPPKVTVSGAGATTCTWVINGGSSTSYTCSSGLSALDLSSYSSEGLNTFKATIDGLNYKAEYIYYSSAEELEEVVASSFGSGGDGATGLEFVIGDVGSGTFIDPEAGKAAIVAMIYDLGRSSATTVDKRNQILDVIKNSDAIRNELSAISAATDISVINFGVMRTADLTAEKAKAGYKANFNMYTSKKEGDSWTSSQKGDSTEFSFSKVGETRIRVKIGGT